MVNSRRPHDVSWEGFGEWLRGQMDSSGVKPSELASRLDSSGGTPTSTIYKWRDGIQKPPLRTLPHIAQVLGVDPVDIAIQLGVLPPAYRGRAQVNLVARLSALQAEVTNLQAVHADVRRAAAMNGLVEAVTAHEGWGLAIQPVFETVRGEPFHLADSLAFRRSDGSETTHEDVLVHFGASLKQLHAAKSGAPGWPEAGPSTTLVRFSIPVYSRPARPAGPLRQRCPSVVVLSTTIKSWAPVFAKRLSEHLSYGLTSGLDLAAATRDISIDETKSPERAVQTAILIRNPPDRFVSYHYESSLVRDSLTVESLAAWGVSEAKVIWLRESDSLLQHAVQYRSDTGQSEIAGDLPAALAHREAVDARIARLERHALTVNVELPPGAEPTQDPGTMRGARIDAAISAADATFERMRSLGWVSAVHTD